MQCVNGNRNVSCIENARLSWFQEKLSNLLLRSWMIPQVDINVGEWSACAKKKKKKKKKIFFILFLKKNYNQQTHSQIFLPDWSSQSERSGIWWRVCLSVCPPCWGSHCETGRGRAYLTWEMCSHSKKRMIYSDIPFPLCRQLFQFRNISWLVLTYYVPIS